MIYLMSSERGVYICGTNPDTDDKWESSAVEVMDAHSANFAPSLRLPAPVLENIIRNVLRITNIEVG